MQVTDAKVYEYLIDFDTGNRRAAANYPLVVQYLVVHIKYEVSVGARTGAPMAEKIRS